MDTNLLTQKTPQGEGLAHMNTCGELIVSSIGQNDSFGKAKNECDTTKSLQQQSNLGVEFLKVLEVEECSEQLTREYVRQETTSYIEKIEGMVSNLDVDYLESVLLYNSQVMRLEEQERCSQLYNFEKLRDSRIVRDFRFRQVKNIDKIYNNFGVFSGVAGGPWYDRRKYQSAVKRENNIKRMCVNLQNRIKFVEDNSRRSSYRVDPGNSCVNSNVLLDLDESRNKPQEILEFVYHVVDGPTENRVKEKKVPQVRDSVVKYTLENLYNYFHCKNVLFKKSLVKASWDKYSGRTGRDRYTKVIQEYTKVNDRNLDNEIFLSSLINIKHVKDSKKLPDRVLNLVRNDVELDRTLRMMTRSFPEKVRKLFITDQIGLAIRSEEEPVYTFANFASSLLVVFLTPLFSIFRFGNWLCDACNELTLKISKECDERTTRFWIAYCSWITSSYVSVVFTIGTHPAFKLLYSYIHTNEVWIGFNLIVGYYGMFWYGISIMTSPLVGTLFYLTLLVKPIRTIFDKMRSSKLAQDILKRESAEPFVLPILANPYVWVYQSLLSAMETVTDVSWFERNMHTNDFLTVMSMLAATSNLQLQIAFANFTTTRTYSFIVHKLICINPHVAAILGDLSKIFEITERENNTDGIEVQGPAEDIMRNVSRISKSPLVVRTLSYLSYMCSYTLGFNLSGRTLFVNESIAYLVKNVTETTSATAATIDLLGYWTSRFTAFSKSGNFQDLFELSGEEKYLEKLEIIRALFDGLIKSTNPRKDLLDIKQLIMECLRSSNRVVLDQVISLENMRLDKVASLNLKRERPIGLIFVGPPNVGKTVAINSLIDVWKARKGIDPSVDVIMYHADTKHQKAPTMPLVYVVNDAFQTNEEIVAAKGNTTMSMMQGLVDTAPYRFEGASIEEKDSSNLAPEWVIFTTNTERYKMTSCTSGADKLNHRYVVVHFRKKEETMDSEFDASNMEYVVSKLRNKNDNILDLKFIANDSDKKFQSYPELVNHLLDMHANRPTARVETVFCPCVVPNLVGHALCPYSDLEAQGGLLSVASEQVGVAVETLVETVAGLHVPVTMRHELNSDAMERMENIARGVSSPQVVFSVDPRTMDYFDSRFQTVANFIKFVVVLKVIHSTLLFLLPKIFGESIKEQGPTISTLSNVIKEEIAVRELKGIDGPWLEDKSGTFIVKLYGIDAVTMYGIMVNINIMMTPFHFFKDFKDGDEFIIEQIDGKKFPFKKYDKFVYRLGNSDLCFVFVPGLTGQTRCAHSLLVESIGTPLTECNIKYLMIDVQPKNVVYISNAGEKLFRYNCTNLTKNGYCGLPLIDAQGHLLGMHKGVLTMDKSVGFAVPVTAGDVRKSIFEFQKRGVSVALVSDEIPICKQAGLNEGLHPRSVLAQHVKWNGDDLIDHDHIPIAYEASFDNQRVTAHKTELFEQFSDRLEEEYGPPCMKKYVVVDDKYLSKDLYRLQAMGGVCNFDPVCLDKSVAAMLRDIETPVSPLEPLDLYRSVCGDHLNVFMNPRDNSKSIGMTLRYKKKTKEMIFVADNDSWKMDTELQNDVKSLIEIIRKREPLPVFPTKATLKDEVYPLKKSNLGKGRYFYVSDLSLNLVMRMYLLPLMAFLMEKPYQSGVVVAINAGSPHWKGLYNEISKFGTGRMVDFDHTNYDQKHSVAQYWYCNFMVGLARKCGYSEDNQRMVEGCILTTFRYLLSMGGNFLLCSTGLLSGLSDTIIRNCIIGKMITYYAYYRKDCSDKEPREVLVSMNTGDDNITAIAEGLKLDGLDIVTYAKELNYKMTAADKSEFFEFKDISEIQYLKRKFVVEGNRVWAPLLKESIFRSLCYTVDSKCDERERNKSAMLCACKEMFLHGKVSYDELVVEAKTVFPELVLAKYEDLLFDFDNGIFRLWDGLTWECGAELPLMETVEIEGQSQERVPRECESQRDPNVLSEVCSPVIIWNQSGLDLWYQTRINHITTEINDNNKTIVADSTVNPITTIGAVDTSVESLGYVARPLVDKTPEMDLKHFFARPRIIMSGTTAVLPVATEAFLVWSNILPVQNVLKEYAYFRGDLTLTFSYTGSPQHMGLFRMYATMVANNTPYNPGITRTTPNLLYPIIDSSISSQIPHVDADLSLVGTKILKLPFNKNITWMQKNSSSWNILIVPINDLRMANGLTAQPLSLTVYAHYDNVELSNILLQAGEVQQASISGLLKYSRALVKRLPSRWLAPIDRVLKLGEDLAGYMGWSRPNMEAQTSVVTRPWMNPAVAGGQPDFSYTLALDPNVHKNTDGALIPLFEEGQTNFQYLVNKDCMLIVDLAPATPFQITPSIGISSVLTGRWNTTPVWFACSMFKYWSGSMNVCFEIIGSPLVRWRIGIVIVPPSVVMPVAFPTNGSLITYTVEIAGSTCFDFEVPYLYQEPFQSLRLDDYLTVPVTETRIVYFSLMDPTGPAATPVFPYVNIVVKGGKTLTAGVPDLTLANRYKIINQSSIEEQGGIGELSMATFGEIVEDLLLLTRRSSKLSNFTKTANLLYLAIPVQPTCTYDTVPLFGMQKSVDWTFHTWLSCAYIGETGSIVYKFKWSNNDSEGMSFSMNEALVIPGIVAPTPLTFSLQESSAIGGLIGDTRNLPIVEVRNVDRNYKNFRNTAPPPDVNNLNAMWCNVFRFDQNNSQPTVQVWESAGDDLVIGGYWSSPSLYVRT